MIHVDCALNQKDSRYFPCAKASPLAIQLGGNDPLLLSEASKIFEDRGFDEINLNVGCPSERVQKGAFGACLMADPPLVAECVFKMQQATKLPVTVKTRIGIDLLDSEEFLHEFIQKISMAGCQKFIIHARKAWLKGLNPKQNRQIPPLRYEVVYQLKKVFPHLIIILNGGITDTQIDSYKSLVDGVMIGRQAYKEPFMFYGIDTPTSVKSNSTVKNEIIQGYLEYVQQKSSSYQLPILLKPLTGLFYKEHFASLARSWMHQVLMGQMSLKVFESHLKEML